MERATTRNNKPDSPSPYHALSYFTQRISRSCHSRSTHKSSSRIAIHSYFLPISHLNTHTMKSAQAKPVETLSDLARLLLEEFAVMNRQTLEQFAAMNEKLDGKSEAFERQAESKVAEQCEESAQTVFEPDGEIVQPLKAALEVEVPLLPAPGPSGPDGANLLDQDAAPESVSSASYMDELLSLSLQEGDLHALLQEEEMPASACLQSRPINCIRAKDSPSRIPQCDPSENVRLRGERREIGRSHVLAIYHCVLSAFVFDRGRMCCVIFSLVTDAYKLVL